MTTVNNFIDKISNEQTALLPAIEFRGEIRIVEQERDIAAACKLLAEQSVIGFDTETRPSFRPGVTFRVSLLQLSTPKVCFLFRLNKIPLAKPILQLLEDKKVLKIGADVAGDLRSLRQIRHFRDGGFVDLQSIASEWGIGEKSLRKLSAIVLGQRVSKAQRLSNWEATTLTDKQQLYAATDAWVCTRIYEQLLRTPKKPIRK
ncbi:3'-5' exonuclease domain-containing protein 2 [Alistipes sp. kh20]|mgnify:FL=1|uniref:3'-5' exonuclease n=1 Tax=Alistipes TaxID=239759 RepID=UPI0018987D2C|nr:MULTISPECIES: 3'-5' exonuclease [Alistipes]MBS4766890.1 3'-5' exonuclease domain-containing protein 2 [Alistipes montrealensis]